MPCTQTYGVTVAQVILVHFVEVRILVGLPFFLSLNARNVRNPRKKSNSVLENFIFPPEFFFFALFIFCGAKNVDYSLSGGCLALLALRSAMLTHVGALRLRRILAGLPFFCGKRAASRCRTAPLSQFDRFAPSGVFLFGRLFQ